MSNSEYEGFKKQATALDTQLKQLKTMKATKPDEEEKETKKSTKLNGEDCISKNFSKCDLDNSDIQRYSRQMILPEIGVRGQLKLKNASVLVVGAGGLGCPASLYLVAAGVGTIGIVDYDSVDLSNLHRQVLHTEDKIGIGKVESAIQHLKRVNSSINFQQHSTSLSSQNALEIIQKYDVVLDCTDNVATRYLLNDACVFCKKPLVSGSALRFEGQLIVYNYLGGPCYRCLHPVPPPSETVTNCSDGGVFGAVTGVIGSLQALEVIKIITNQQPSCNGKLLLYDGWEGSFKSIKLRNRQDNCNVCGVDPTITKLLDYEQFCGSKASDKEKYLNVLAENERITVENFEEIRASKSAHLLVDVRPAVEYEICSLNSSINIPLTDINHGRNLKEVERAFRAKTPVYVVCKRGNDSQHAVRRVAEFFNAEPQVVGNERIFDDIVLKDLIGGLQAWSQKIDSNFPTY